ncbi:DEAD-domain-containing protein [Coprinopsis marcescibilis]|uniref:RNA helicase n=1 Tax=Coprinopsis marcescibilis TaxID=230819 RepID=A0A5C3KHC5_COPMA|nr:DEAD-domain-containing protein [Coprinopsis marcescibilis]
MMRSKDATKKTSLKRKLKSASSAPRKKFKIESNNLQDLPWKSVTRPVETVFGGDEGILELEEVDDVEVVYEETDAGRVARFKVPVDESEEEDKQSDSDESDDDDEGSETAETDTFDCLAETLLPEWHSLGLHPKLGRALYSKGFLTPTEIQKEALPLALQDRDIVGIAQTGSGKTLAYGLPILNYLLNQKKPSSKRRRRLRALIIAPTRELALQVTEHLTDILKASKLKNDEAEPIAPGNKPPPHVSIAAIVGGMSAQKQKRMLDRGVDILIATPGRLWDILDGDDDLANEIKQIRFLVLDEADRMVETGHYAELDNILRFTLRQSDSSDQIDDGNAEENDEDITLANQETDLQTFVFSATLSKDLQRNLKKARRPKNPKKKDQPTSTLDDLLLRLDFRDPEPEIVDLSPEGSTVSTLKQGRINCLLGDKDVYLYYFLLRHPGRSLVFLSAIDGIRRLQPLLEFLNVQAFPLHSQMEQRQRLKNLDRFKTIPNAVLLATDVAARGLDIPAVDHVIHFQIPRTADTYIHRNGRTARANREGFSMLMCAPDERRVVKALMNSLGRDEQEIPELDPELSMLDKLKARVQVAKQIETAQHQVKKKKHERNWMKETAEALEVDLDSDFFTDEEISNVEAQKQRAKAAKIFGLKAQLKKMLAEPLIARGVSARYITSGTRPIVEDLLSGRGNTSIIGVNNDGAHSELKMVERKPKQRSKPKLTPQEKAQEKKKEKEKEKDKRKRKRNDVQSD